MMLQVDLGASRADLRVPPHLRAAAVQEHCEQPAEVQQGERQVPHSFDILRRPPQGLSPLVRQQSTSASYTQSLRSLA